jgi:hypothetical protein
MNTGWRCRFCATRLQDCRSDRSLANTTKAVGLPSWLAFVRRWSSHLCPHCYLLAPAVCFRSATLHLRRLRRHVVPSAQVLVHEVHSMLRGLKKADVKQSRISLLWSHSLVVHQCQQKALGIPQRQLVYRRASSMT